jgi:hypothetical protein
MFEFKNIQLLTSYKITKQIHDTNFMSNYSCSFSDSEFIFIFIFQFFDVANFQLVITQKKI